MTRFRNLSVIFLAVLLPCLCLAVEPSELALDKKLIQEYEKKYENEGDHSAIINAVTNNEIQAISLNREKLLDHNTIFNVKAKSNKITNQKSSGRCWLFAALNVFSPKIMKKLDISQFQLSEPYLTFWDKIEKANVFLEAMIELRDSPIDDRTVVAHIRYPVGDGGWWRYVTDLLDKYGAVPISAMPETKQSVLRGFASELRQMNKTGKSEEELRTRKEEMLFDVYKLMVYNYGPPPKEFKFRYESKDTTKSISEEKTYTPESFYKEFINPDMPEYAELMDDASKEYDELYRYEWSRNMADKEDIKFLNLPVSKLKEYCLKALLDSQVVYFACDVGKENLNDSGIFKVDIYDYNKTFDLDFKLTREERVLYRETSPNHAMAFIGVDTTSDGKPAKWLVKNSWGKKRGDDGKWYMYDDWFDQYVYAAVIDMNLLSKEDREKFKKKPIPVPIWDPFASALREINF